MGKNGIKKNISVSKKVHYHIAREILDSEGKYKSADDYLIKKLKIEDNYKKEGGFF